MRAAPITLLLVVAAPRADACTAFEIARDGEEVVGKCYDWSMGQGLVIVNKRGVGKRALPLHPTDKPAEWRSRYASLTFNQYGREMPNGGINSAGLVAEVLWLDESVYPRPDARPTVNELQWVQFQLDNYASTAEVVAHADDLRVADVSGKVHYFVCDRTGACAALEYVAGKMVVSSGATLPAPVLTNDTYARSTEFARSTHREPGGAGSLARFWRAEAKVARAKHAALDDALEVLGAVKNGASQWQIVYDPQRLRVAFRTAKSGKLKRVDLARFDASCRTPPMVLDIDADLEGDVGEKFHEYTSADNRRIVEPSLAKVEGLPAGTLERLVDYPARLPCQER
jgi:choloylglycine hydrolase